MRIVTWNIRSLRDSRADVVSVARDLGPDVLCLQEVPRFLLGTWQVRRLAADCGLVVAAAGRPAGEVAVLVRPGVRVLADLRMPLPWTPGRHRRGVALALLELDGRRLVVGSFHLGLRADERSHHAELLLERMAALVAPSALAGDVNESAEGPAWRRLAASYQDAWLSAGDGDGRTFSTSRPRRRIDGVFVDRRLHVDSAHVPSDAPVARASDHRPVVADVRWSTKPP